MARKLFALEEAELEGEVIEMEAAPEVGEVADVEVEVQEEISDIASQEEAIDEGMEAADQLEEVQDVAEAAAEDEGLDATAAECLRIAVEAICARVGANPKAMYSLYATENFQSASSRKANTKIALEGIGEFLKDLWKKIKTALVKLWEKAKAFFDKHFSSLNRIKSALESMKKKVSESSGKIKDKAYFEEAPSSLVEAFAGKEDISPSVIRKYILAHSDSTEKSDEFTNKINNFNNKIAENIGKTVTKADIEDALKKTVAFNGAGNKEIINLGTSDKPLIGGVCITYTFTADSTEGSMDLDVDHTTIDDAESNLGINVADKSELSELIKDTMTIINNSIKVKEKFSKYQTEFSKFMLFIEKAIIAFDKTAGATDVTPEQKTNIKNNVKELRKFVKIIYKFNSKVPAAKIEMFSLNVKLAKAVLNYVSFALKQYKAV